MSTGKKSKGQRPDHFSNGQREEYVSDDMSVADRWRVLRRLVRSIPPADAAKLRPRSDRQRFFDLDAAKPHRVDAPLTNRGVSNRHSTDGMTQCLPPSAPVQSKFLCGEDRAEIVLFVRWNHWGNLKAVLERAKENAMQAEHSGEFVENMIPGEWLVNAHGFRMGGVFCRYRLQGHGCEIGIMNREEFAPTTPNVKVVIGSVALMEFGFAACWEMLEEYLTGCGGVIEKAVLSRIDYCCDLYGAEYAIDLFCAKFLQRHWVSRGRKFRHFASAEVDEASAEFHGEGLKFTGFSLGRGIRMTVYDKLRETRTQEEKRAVMIAQRWRGEIPGHATRVEFQIRRDYLKEFKFEEIRETNGELTEGRKEKFVVERSIDSPEDWIRERGRVLEYLASEWFRFTETEPDAKNGNQSRADDWSVWTIVRESLVACAGGCWLPIARTVRKQVDKKHLRCQGRGVMLSLFALSGRWDGNPESLDLINLKLWLSEEITNEVDGMERRRLIDRLNRTLRDSQAKSPLG